MFYGIQELMKKRKKFHNKKCYSDDTYYFRVLRCSCCNSKYHATQQVQGGKKYITYRWNGHHNNSCNAPGFSHYKLEYSFLKYLDNIKDFKFNKNVLQKEDKLTEKEEEIIETNEDLIKEIIVNLKSNFVRLDNREKKIFLERFVKDIRVKKEVYKVMIESVVF